MVEPGGRARPGRVARAVLGPVLALALAGCGSDPPAAYDDQTRTNVLTACTDEGDTALVGDVCTCAYRTLRTRLPYERFAQIDAELRVQPTVALPDEVLDALARCIIEVGDL